MSEVFRYWSLASGIMGLLIVLLRISFQMGSVSRRFSDHIKDSEREHKSIWRQLDWLRDRRR